jgi:putative FmdB family regulatory protein
MPTYDYECGSCDHRFELFQGINDPKKKKCPSCGRLSLRRLFGSGAALLFKGSGFYQTDYRSESYKKGAAADTKSKKSKSDKKKSSSKSKSASKSTANASA